MPNFLLTHKDQELREKYDDYCLKVVLSGEEAKPFEEFSRISIVRRINIDIVTLLKMKERVEHVELMKLLEDKANEFHSFCPYSCPKYHFYEARCQAFLGGQKL